MTQVISIKQQYLVCMKMQKQDIVVYVYAKYTEKGLAFYENLRYY